MYREIKPNVREDKEFIKSCKRENTALIAFIYGLYNGTFSSYHASEETNTPAIVMLYPEHVSVQHTTGFCNFASMVKELAKEVKIPIGLHADHGYSYDAVVKTMMSGFDSIMIDGSMYSLEKNISITKEVVDKAHSMGVCVEGEIGHVGLAREADNNKEDLYTKPEAARKFCEAKIGCISNFYR